MTNTSATPNASKPEPTSPGPTSKDKLCAICAIDCTARPRTKDPQGRYVCMECVERAKQARSTQQAKAAPGVKPVDGAGGLAAPADDNDNSFLLNLGSQSALATEGTHPCPECTRPLSKSTVVCTNCGFNSQTGKKLAVKILKPQKEKGQGPKNAGPAMSEEMKLGLVYFLFLCGAGAMPFVNPELRMVAAIMLSLCGFLVYVGTVVSAWSNSVLQGVLCLIPFYNIFYVFVLSGNSRLKWIWTAHILGLIVANVLFQTAPASSGGGQ